MEANALGSLAQALLGFAQSDASKSHDSSDDENPSDIEQCIPNLPQNSQHSEKNYRALGRVICSDLLGSLFPKAVVIVEGLHLVVNQGKSSKSWQYPVLRKMHVLYRNRSAAAKYDKSALVLGCIKYLMPKPKWEILLWAAAAATSKIFTVHASRVKMDKSKGMCTDDSTWVIAEGEGRTFIAETLQPRICNKL